MCDFHLLSKQDLRLPGWCVSRKQGSLFIQKSKPKFLALLQSVSVFWPDLCWVRTWPGLLLCFKCSDKNRWPLVLLDSPFSLWSPIVHGCTRDSEYVPWHVLRLPNPAMFLKPLLSCARNYWFVCCVCAWTTGILDKAFVALSSAGLGLHRKFECVTNQRFLLSLGQVTERCLWASSLSRACDRWQSYQGKPVQYCRFLWCRERHSFVLLNGLPGHDFPAKSQIPKDRETLWPSSISDEAPERCTSLQEPWTAQFSVSRASRSDNPLAAQTLISKTHFLRNVVQKHSFYHQHVDLKITVLNSCRPKLKGNQTCFSEILRHQERLGRRSRRNWWLTGAARDKGHFPENVRFLSVKEDQRAILFSGVRLGRNDANRWIYSVSWPSPPREVSQVAHKNNC